MYLSLANITSPRIEKKVSSNMDNMDNIMGSALEIGINRAHRSR